jgi:uncharacterized protein
MSDEVSCVEHLRGKNSKIMLEGEKCTFLPDKNHPPTFILGFAGVGMIGTILCNELIEQLEMKQIGYVLSEDLPPITLFYDGILKHPFRLYFQEKYNLLVSICEVPFVPGTYTDLARTLMSWALKSGIKDVVCVQGMADRNVFIREGPYPVFAAGEAGHLDKIIKNGVEKPPKGLIMGVEAAILNECLNDKLNGAVFLTTANPQIPAPEGAAAILEKLSVIYGFPIKTDKLLEQGTEIKQNLLELAQKTNEMASQMPGPSTNRDNLPLYS